MVLRAASAAPVGVGLFALLLGLGVPPVTEWFWPTPTTNVAEAASLGDGARLLQLAREGVPLDAPLPIRADIRERDEPSDMSPLEAAIRRRRDSIVEILLELGARPTIDEVNRLYCLAERVQATDAAELLRKTFLLSGVTCEAPPR